MAEQSVSYDKVPKMAHRTPNIKEEPGGKAGVIPVAKATRKRRGWLA